MKVVIVGGGLAGLACAVDLLAKAKNNNSKIEVTVYEARAMFGGRAYSFTEPKTGQIIDNGQHLLHGSYTSTLEYSKTIGALTALDQREKFTVDFAEAGGNLRRLKCPTLPAPLHLVAGLWNMPGFSRGDLFRLAWGARKLLQQNEIMYSELDSISIAEWCKLLGQSKEACALFWEPLTLAVMNETMERASAAPFATMLREGMFARDITQGLIFPRAGLSETLIDPALKFITQHGGAVRSGSPVQEIIVQDNRIIGISTSKEKNIEADFFVLALPPRQLSELLQRSHVHSTKWDKLPEWESVPILSVHLWYDKEALPSEMVALHESDFHWAFSKPISAELRAQGVGSCVALVSSACRDLIKQTRAEIIEYAAAEMLKFFPESLVAAKLMFSQLTKELHATVSVGVNSANRRFPPDTEWKNCWLAGDWTNTNLPATIESAVRSGQRASRMLQSA